MNNVLVVILLFSHFFFGRLAASMIARISNFTSINDRSMTFDYIIDQYVDINIQNCILKCQNHPKCLSLSTLRKSCVLYSEDYRNIDVNQLVTSKASTLFSMDKLDCFKNGHSNLFTQSNNCNLNEKTVQPSYGQWSIQWKEVFNDTCIGKVKIGRMKNRTCNWPTDSVRKLKIDYLKKCEGSDTDFERIKFNVVNKKSTNFETTEKICHCDPTETSCEQNVEGKSDVFSSIHLLCDEYESDEPKLGKSRTKEEQTYWTSLKVAPYKGSVTIETFYPEPSSIEVTIPDAWWGFQYPQKVAHQTCVMMRHTELINIDCDNSAPNDLIFGSWILCNSF